MKLRAGQASPKGLINCKKAAVPKRHIEIGKQKIWEEGGKEVIPVNQALEHISDDIVVNIRLPSGEHAQLVIRGCDDRSMQLNEFVKEHQLSAEMAEKLIGGIVRSLE